MERSELKCPTAAPAVFLLASQDLNQTAENSQFTFLAFWDAAYHHLRSKEEVACLLATTMNFMNF